MKQKLFVVLMLFSVLLSACSGGTRSAAEVDTTTTPQAIPTAAADGEIIAEGRLQPARDAEIAFTTSGVIGEVLVKEGEAVKQGQPLIRLGDASDTHYAQAQLELVTAEKALNDLTNVAGTDLAQAVIDLKQAQEDFNKADDYLHYLQNSEKIPRTEVRSYLVQTWKGYEYRTRTKYVKGPAPQDWIVEAQNDLNLKKAKLDEAQRTYDRLKGGVDEDQLKVLQARLDAAKAALAAFEVVAPFDGVVANLPVKAGGSIIAGQSAITIADFSSWLVKTTDLTEIDVVNLKEGQPVTVTLDALPGVELKGEILSIGQNYGENQGDIVYEVTILLTDTDPGMRWGMTAAVRFD